MKVFLGMLWRKWEDKKGPVGLPSRIWVSAVLWEVAERIGYAMKLDGDSQVEHVESFLGNDCRPSEDDWQGGGFKAVGYQNASGAFAYFEEREMRWCPELEDPDITREARPTIRPRRMIMFSGGGE